MKKIFALVLVCICTFQMCSFAADFKDMPDDWSTAALETAVKNGLLTGDNGYIKASDNMTRAEMATIMVRACGATRMTDITSFTDVKNDDWFCEAMNKAVAMGAFKGSDNKLNPESPITRQEAFVVLSRVFGVAAGSVVNKDVLGDFNDADKIEDWAKNDVAAIIEQGYVAGNNGYIKPLDNISRAEFAVVMDRMIKYYVDEVVDQIPTDGNVMIRTRGIDYTGLSSENTVILGDAIGEEDIAIKNANMTGKLVLRGGKNIVAGGSYGSAAIISPGIKLSAGDGVFKRVYVCKDSVFNTSALVTGQGE